MSVNISKRKDNQGMKFGQLIKVNWEMFFVKNDAVNVVQKLVTDKKRIRKG